MLTRTYTRMLSLSSRIRLKSNSAAYRRQATAGAAAPSSKLSILNFNFFTPAWALHPPPPPHFKFFLVFVDGTDGSIQPMAVPTTIQGTDQLPDHRGKPGQNIIDDRPSLSLLMAMMMTRTKTTAAMTTKTSRQRKPSSMLGIESAQLQGVSSSEEPPKYIRTTQLLVR